MDDVHLYELSGAKWYHDNSIVPDAGDEMTFMFDVLLRHEREGTYIDVGANAGVGSFYPLQKGAKKVYSFEAAVPNVAYLKKVLCLNSFGPPSFMLVPYAAGAVDGKEVFFDNHETPNFRGSNFNNGMIREGLKAGMEGVVSQRVQRVDTTVSRADTVVFMKVDVEGFELHVLLGATRLFQQQPLPPLVYFEFSPSVVMIPDEFKSSKIGPNDDIIKAPGHRLLDFIVDNGYVLFLADCQGVKDGARDDFNNFLSSNGVRECHNAEDAKIRRAGYTSTILLSLYLEPGQASDSVRDLVVPQSFFRALDERMKIGEQQVDFLAIPAKRLPWWNT